MADETNDITKNPILAKLKDDYIALIVGAILGIPALGIVVPQLFSVLNNMSSLSLPCLFRLFSIIYFTIPFFALVVLTIFQLNNWEVMGLKNRLSWFILFTTIIAIEIIIISDSSLGSCGVAWGILILSCILLLLYYIVSLLQRIATMGNEYEKYYRQPESSSYVTYQNTSEPVNPDHIRVAIKIGFLILFIPIQWLISIVITSDYRLSSNLGFIILCGLLYFIPLLIYCFYPPVSIFKRNVKFSGTFVPSVLGYTGLLLFALLLFPNINNVHSGGYCFKNSEQVYRNKFSRILKGDSIDSSIVSVDYLLVSNQLVSTFNYAITKNPNAANSDLKKLIYRNLIPGNTALKSKTAGYIINSFISKDQPATDFTAAFGKRADNNYDDVPMAKEKVGVLKSYLYSLRIDSTLNNDLAQTDLGQVINDTQKNGIIIFISTLIILSAFILILYFKDGTYELEKLDEVGRIRKIVQIVFLIVAVLLIPLVKVIPPEKINPHSPGSMFLISNWNLTGSSKNSGHAIDDTVITTHLSSNFYKNDTSTTFHVRLVRDSALKVPLNLKIDSTGISSLFKGNTLKIDLSKMPAPNITVSPNITLSGSKDTTPVYVSFKHSDKDTTGQGFYKYLSRLQTELGDLNATLNSQNLKKNLPTKPDTTNQ